MPSFLLVIVDHDKKVFVIEGPMDDDKPWTDALIDAQDEGRSVTFFKPSPRATREMVAEKMKAEFGYKESKRVLRLDP